MSGFTDVCSEPWWSVACSGVSGVTERSAPAAEAVSQRAARRTEHGNRRAAAGDRRTAAIPVRWTRGAQHGDKHTRDASHSAQKRRVRFCRISPARPERRRFNGHHRRSSYNDCGSPRHRADVIPSVTILITNKKKKKKQEEIWGKRGRYYYYLKLRREDVLWLSARFGD